jgi:hypothetical protein
MNAVHACMYLKFVSFNNFKTELNFFFIVPNERICYLRANNKSFSSKECFVVFCLVSYTLQALFFQIHLFILVEPCNVTLQTSTLILHKQFNFPFIFTTSLVK